ncbi:hypothetical protein HAX54_046244 [Datura stramonium]|uniref:Uncharacterized protein n=1 Tax=Datura stramonium TaxID=4076 RepID=A0ABS8WGP1_DATST|nr:hypothetical protein [Datura stramonium]
MIVVETRAKTVEENIKRLETQLVAHIVEANQKFSSNDSKLDDMGKKLDVLMEKMLLPNQAKILGSVPLENRKTKEPSNRQRGEQWLSPMVMETTHHYNSKAMEKAKHQEKVMDAMNRRNKIVWNKNVPIGSSFQGSS